MSGYVGPNAKQLTDLTVSGNRAGTDGGGAAFGGPVGLLLERVAFSDNVAAGDGGGVLVYGSAYGAGRATCTDCTFERNGSARGGAARVSRGVLTLVDSELGTGVDDNLPDDVSAGSDSRGGLGAGTNLTCDRHGC